MTNKVPKVAPKASDVDAAFTEIVGILNGLSSSKALQLIQRILNQYLAVSGVELPKPKKSKRITRGRLSKIQRDAELEAFLLANLSNTPQKDLLDLCIKHFGIERAPSRSALSRFLSDVATKEIDKGKAK